MLIKVGKCPTPSFFYNQTVDHVIPVGCGGWVCNECSWKMRRMVYGKLAYKIDMRGVRDAKALCFTLESPYDEEGNWLEIGTLFSKFRKSINKPRKCSACPVLKPRSPKKEGWCWGEIAHSGNKTNICCYKLDEYFWVREIQMHRLIETGVPVRHLHVLAWFEFIPWRLLQHYWRWGDVKVESLAVGRNSPKEASLYFVKYLNKPKVQELYFKNEKRLYSSRGFFDYRDDWLRDFAGIKDFNEKDIWLYWTYHKAPDWVIKQAHTDNPEIYPALSACVTDGSESIALFAY